MKKILLLFYIILFHFHPSKAQDTLVFNGFIATNYYYSKEFYVKKDLSKGPCGNIEQISLEDTNTNLKGIGTFLVSKVPSSLSNFEFENYAPQERTNVDIGNEYYDKNNLMLHDSSIVKYCEKRFNCKYKNKNYFIRFSFSKVKLLYTIFGFKNLKVITERGIQYKKVKLIHIIKILPA